MLHNLSFKHQLPEDVLIIDITSRSQTWGKYLSPFNLGPIQLYDGYWAYNLENAYQFAKVYPEHVDFDNNVKLSYFEWAIKGWLNKKPIKYPFGAWNKGLFHLWENKRLSHLEAQNQIFLPLYKEAVIKTTAFNRLKELYAESKKDIILLDFEGFDYRFLNLSLEDVKNSGAYPVGQGFALMMIFEGII